MNTKLNFSMKFDEYDKKFVGGFAYRWYNFTKNIYCVSYNCCILIKFKNF